MSDSEDESQSHDSDSGDSKVSVVSKASTITTYYNALSLPHLDR